MRCFLSFFIVFFLFFSFPKAYANDFDNFVKYKVRRGDTLSKICKNNPDLIFLTMKINRIDQWHLQAGKTIFVPRTVEEGIKFCPVPKTIKAKNKRLIVFYLDNQYFGAYEKGELIRWGPISSGIKGHETPKGVFRALWKAKKYRSKKYKAPMPYSVNISSLGYFFHAQALPGKPASHGCIRLLRKDARFLYKWVRIGDNIIIK